MRIWRRLAPLIQIIKYQMSHLLVILQAEDRASVACEDSLVLLQRLEIKSVTLSRDSAASENAAQMSQVGYLSVPHLDRVVPQAGHDLGVVILE